MWLLVAQLLIGLVAVIRGHHVVRVILLVFGAFMLRRGFGQLGLDPLFSLIADILIAAVLAYMAVVPPQEVEPLEE